MRAWRVERKRSCRARRNAAFRRGCGAACRIVRRLGLRMDMAVDAPPATVDSKPRRASQFFPPLPRLRFVSGHLLPVLRFFHGVAARVPKCTLPVNRRLDACVRVFMQAASASFHSGDLRLLTGSAVIRLRTQDLERLVQSVAVDSEIKIRNLTLLGCPRLAASCRASGQPPRNGLTTSDYKRQDMTLSDSPSRMYCGRVAVCWLVLPGVDGGF